MNTGHKISFNSIANISPVTSTFADVTRQLGTDFKVERVPSRRNKRGLTTSKVVLHFQKFGLAIVFNSADFSLLPEAPVLIIGAEAGCNLQTGDNLRIGMSLIEAKEIVEKNYTVQYESPGCIELLPITGERQTYLTMHHNSDQIEFIGLHRIQTEESGRR